MLRISTATVCFNNLPELQETIRSVDVQEMLPYEHIIIDGSTNGEIRAWLEGTPQPSYRKWICEPDHGISDAFSKGVINSSGEIVHLLHSGDMYFDSIVLSKVHKAFETHPDITWLHGRYVQYRAGTSVISGKPFEKDKLYRGMRQVGHLSMFVKKEVYDRYGLFEIDKKIAMDYDFLVRIRNEKFIFLDEILVKFAPEGVSERKFVAGLKEVEESYSRHVGSSFKQKLWMIRTRTLNDLMHTGLGRFLFRLKNRNKIENL